MQYLEMILNTVIVYFVILLIIRLLGKREIGEISIFDLVVLLLIADISTLGMQMGDMLLSIIALFCLVILQKVLSYIVLKYPKLRNTIDGKYSIIIINNKVNIKEMKKQKYTFDDLITQTREKGILTLNEIELAILEASGELSVFKKKESISILPVVISGRIDNEAMTFLKIEEKVLLNFIKKLNKKMKEINYIASDGENFFTINDFLQL